jgi:hypothetical protein
MCRFRHTNYGERTALVEALVKVGALDMAMGSTRACGDVDHYNHDDNEDSEVDVSVYKPR